MATITHQPTDGTQTAAQTSSPRVGLTPLEWFGSLFALVFAVIALGELGALSSHVATAHVRQGRTGALLGLCWFGGLAFLWITFVALRMSRRFRARRAGH